MINERPISVVQMLQAYNQNNNDLHDYWGNCLRDLAPCGSLVIIASLTLLVAAAKDYAYIFTHFEDILVCMPKLLLLFSNVAPASSRTSGLGFTYHPLEYVGQCE